MIESFYDRWYATWAPAIGEGQCEQTFWIPVLLCFKN